MSMNRASLVLEMQTQEDLDAKFINDFFSKWKRIKTQTAEMFKKMEESWKKESDIEEKLGYFG